MEHYDYLVVGSGLFGATFAYQAKKEGKSVLVIDKRSHIAGNTFTQNIDGVMVHAYGAHIFHTNNKDVWNFVNQFAEFNRYTNSPIANYKGELFSLPFNMHTFYQMWGTTTPQQAKAKIENQRNLHVDLKPNNLEEQAIQLVGYDIYSKLIQGYTQKQWGKPCNELPAFIIKRLPVRFTFDNNYFNALYQGIPTCGYTQLVANMLQGIEVRLNIDYLQNRQLFNQMADKIVYTGAIDAYFDYCIGNLEYRSLDFQTEVLQIPNYQGNAVVNFTDAETPYTRIIEHKWFTFGKNERGEDIPHTVITKEFSKQWYCGEEPYYPINDKKNASLFCQYKQMADCERQVIFGGRLAEYAYYDMDVVIDSALQCFENQMRIK